MTAFEPAFSLSHLATNPGSGSTLTPGTSSTQSQAKNPKRSTRATHLGLRDQLFDVVVEECAGREELPVATHRTPTDAGLVPTERVPVECGGLLLSSTVSARKRPLAP